MPRKPLSRKARELDEQVSRQRLASRAAIEHGKKAVRESQEVRDISEQVNEAAKQLLQKGSEMKTKPGLPRRAH